MRHLKTLSRSVFVRTILAFILAAVLLVVLVSLTAKIMLAPDQVMHHSMLKNVSNYFYGLVTQLGERPGQSQVAQMATELGLEMSVEYGDVRLHSPAFKPPQQAQSLWHFSDEARNVRLGHEHGRLYIEVIRFDTQYLFLLERARFAPVIWPFLLVVLIIILAVIGLTHWYIRRLFSPLSSIRDAVASVARGELAHRIGLQRTDELGALADAFDNMSSRVQGMIEARDQLLLDVSHEMRSPLARLKLDLEMMPSGEHREAAQDEVRSLELMIAELLDTARLSSDGEMLHRQACNLPAQLSELVSLYATETPGIVLDLPTEVVPPIMADKTRIEQLLRNLIENALKYSRHQTHPVQISLRVEGAEVDIRVEDHGGGIPAAELAHIFEPFYRVDKSRHARTGGYGLGLHLCQRITQAHGGRICAENTPHGLRLQVLLPFK